MKLKDLTGKKFGRLTVLSFSHMKKRYSYWECLCECGVKKTLRQSSFVSGGTKSCGCLKRESHGGYNTHGLSRKPLYSVYWNMIARCYKESNSDFSSYGGRGITVCDEWIKNKTSFFDWALSNGYRKGLHLDRRDNEKGYYPENCRFVTQKKSHNNRRCTTHFVIHGKYFESVKEAAADQGVTVSTIRSRCGLTKRSSKIMPGYLSLKPNKPKRKK